MKNFAIGLFSLLGAVSAFAEVSLPSSPVRRTVTLPPAVAVPNNKDAALAQCERFRDSDFHDSCVSTVFHAKFFEVGAVRLCSRFTDNDYLLACIKTAANKRFDGEKLKICDYFRTNSQLLSCLANSVAL